MAAFLNAITRTPWHGQEVFESSDDFVVLDWQRFFAIIDALHNR